MKTTSWDQYFLNICDAVASRSKCLSRQIGVVVALDHSVVSTGYNGPARGYPHCIDTPPQILIEDPGDIANDPSLWLGPGKVITVKNFNTGKFSIQPPTCPRRSKGYKSGEGLHECPAAHAEANAIANAARLGVSVRGSTMYMNTKEVACKDCMVLIVNAGIRELVTLECGVYHKMSFNIAEHGKVNLRRFDL
jgi:dCMP deaminase